MRWTMVVAAMLVVTACGAGPATTSTVTTTTDATTSTTATTTTTTTTTLPATTTGPPSPPQPLVDLELAAERVASGFTQPVLVTHRGDDTLFVVDQEGTVWALVGTDRTLVLDIRSRVSFGGERGLLGLAFDPADPQRMFMDSIERGTGDTVVSEYRLPADGLVADPDPVQEILRVPQPAGNHNGGMIAFGPDGYLYIALGDGGGAGDSFGQGQDPFTLLGTILRIDVSHPSGYTIPPDNPFVDGGGAPEVWLWGLRNPWRFSFDGDEVWIADVGQNRVEEIDLLTIADGGANLGWPLLEGTRCFSGTDAQCSDPTLVGPVHEYRHQDGRCSVTGGYVYRGAAFPGLGGTYLFGDYCTGEIMGVRASNGEVVEHRVFPIRVPWLTSFGVDAGGEIYATSGDAVYRLVVR